MDTDRAPDDLHVAFALTAFAYGGALAIVISEIAGVWSAMHSLATLGLLVVGVPVLLVQAVLLRTKRPLARGYDVLFWLSLAFPVLLIALGFVLSRGDG